MATKLSDVTNFLGFTNIKPNQSVPPSGLPSQPQQFQPIQPPEEKKVLLTWETLTRTNHAVNGSARMNKTFLIIGAVIALLLVAMQEFLLIAVIASIIFLRYILGATPARTVRHAITTQGIDYSGEFYTWLELKSFYFTVSDGIDVLCVDTTDRLPGRLYLLLKPGDKEKVKEYVGKYLTFLPVEPKTFVDKMYDAAASKISV